jgi:hypothetical protein
MPTHHAHFALCLQWEEQQTTFSRKGAKGAKNRKTTTTALAQRRKGAKLQPQ